MKFYTTVIAMSLVAIPAFLSADDWAQFRGAGGVSSASANLPTSFTAEKNIAWKLPLPAKGASSPIVVGGKVVVTCSGGEGQDELYTVCVDAETGEKLWTQRFWATGRCFVHPLSANAAPTPTSDGKFIYVFYSSNDLACLDLDGNLIWYRGLAVDFPKAGNDVGMASSPAVKNGVVVVQVECQGDSFAMGLDARNGTTMWTQKRSKDAVWTSPLIIEEKDSPAMVVLQTKKNFEVLDLKSGEVVFRVDGEVSSISSPAVTGGRLFVPVNGTTAYSVSSNGQLTEEWNSPSIRPSSMSTVVNGDQLFTLNRSGVLTSYNANDGTELEKIRVIKGSSAWATPVVANGYMYLFAQGGQSYVVALSGPERQKSKVVHSFLFQDEVFLGSPAISGNAMFVRSDQFLWKIAN